MKRIEAQPGTRVTLKLDGVRVVAAVSQNQGGFSREKSDVLVIILTGRRAGRLVTASARALRLTAEVES